MGVQNKNNSLYWATGIDNSGLKQDADEAKVIIKGMSDDATKSSQSASDAIDKIGQSAINSAKQQIEGQKTIIKQIEEDIKNLEKQFSKAAPGNAKSAALGELTSAKQALEEEKAILTDLEAKVETTADKHVMLRTQISKVKDELAQMEMAGKRGTAEYDVLQKKLGELNDQFKDTAAQAAILADDQRGFQAVTQGVSGMAGAMSAATGVAALFGSENEDLAKVQARLQAVMAITIGLQQVSETLNKDSYFSVVLVTKAKEMWAAAELKLATSIGASTVAARSFMLLTGAGLIVGLVALVAALNNVSEAHKKQRDAAIDAGKKEQASIDEIAKGYASEQSKIQGLISAIHSENVSRDSKLKMIKELKDMIPGYTAELSKEGTVIRENKKAIDDYMASLEKSLKLKAAEKELEAIYTKMYKLQKIADQGSGSGNQLTKGLAKQNQSQSEKVFEDTKKGLAKGATDGIKELQEEADKIKDFISKNGLVSDSTLKNTKDPKNTSSKEEYDAAKHLQALLLDINQKTQTLLIQQQEDGLKKRLALIEDEKQRELSAIREKEVAIIEAYNKSEKQKVDDYNKTHDKKRSFTALSTKPEDIYTSINTATKGKKDPVTGLTMGESLKNAATAVDASYNQKTVEEIKKYGEEVVELSKKFADKRTQIKEQFNADIEKLNKNAKELEEQAVKETDIAVKEKLNNQAELAKNAAKQATVKRDKQVSAETVAMLQETDLYKAAMDEKLNVSAQTTAKLIADIEARIKAEMKAGTLSNEAGKKMLDELNKTGAARDGAKNQNNPFAQLGTAIKNQKTAKSNYDTAKVNLANADPATATAQLAKLESASASATQAMAGAAGASLQGVQDILGSVVGGLDRLGMLTEEQKKDADNIIGMVGGAANLAMGIASGNPMQIIQGSIDLLVNGLKLFDKKSKDIEKAQKAAVKNVKDLQYAYEQLDRAVSQAYSTDKVKLQQKEVANINDQIAANEEWIAQEKKKKKKKQDKEAITEKEREIEQLKLKAQDVQDSMLESVTGVSVMSAIDQFANAYADAFTSGENAAKKSAEVVKNILKSTLIEALKKDLQPGIETLMTTISKAMDDGILDAKEKADIYAQNEKNNAKAQAYNKAFKDLGLDNGSKSGVTGELQSAMTEGTGSQLVGLWNMTAMDIRWIREWLASVSNGSSTAMANDSITQLNAIVSNTWLIQQNTLKSADNVAYIATVINQLLSSRNTQQDTNTNTRNNPRASRSDQL